MNDAHTIDLEQGDSDEARPAAGSARSRRAFLTIAASVPVVLGGGLALDRRVLASDDDDDDHDNSGPGSGDDREDDRDDDDGHGLPPDQSEQVSAVTTVEIIDERFVPNNILIETGQTVTWVNRDDDEHTASGRGMDTGVIDPGSEGTVTFLEPGEFNYTCNFHPEMLGLVTVTGESRATPDADAGSQSAADAPTKVDVDIVDFAFEPEVATIVVGGRVTWSNIGHVEHTIFADWAKSDILAPEETFAFTFEDAGTYEYVCGLHPAMAGTIEVVEAGGAGTDATPVAAGMGVLGVWLCDIEADHPELFPFTVALIGLHENNGVNCSFMAPDHPDSFTAVGRWQSDAEGAFAFDAIGDFHSTETDDVAVISVHATRLTPSGEQMEGDLEIGVTAPDESVSRVSGSVTATRVNGDPSG